MTISWANFEKLFQYGTMFQQGLIVTILLAACTVFFGFILAIFTCIDVVVGCTSAPSFRKNQDG